MNVGVLSRGFEPFVFVNDDSYSGISIEIWERAAKFANIKYKYVDAGKSYSQAIKDLANGKIGKGDLSLLMVVQKLRREKMMDGLLNRTPEGSKLLANVK